MQSLSIHNVKFEYKVYIGNGQRRAIRAAWVQPYYITHRHRGKVLNIKPRRFLDPRLQAQAAGLPKSDRGQVLNIKCTLILVSRPRDTT
jgi:hypothetical protein